VGSRNTGGIDRFARKKYQDGDEKLSNANPFEEYQIGLITAES
jgi:hypothetical protein